jgi:hypothetical protein
VADADQTLGQNVDQESAQKLICGDRHDLLLTAVRVVFPEKRDPIILKRNPSRGNTRTASLDMLVDEVHDLSNFSQGAGFEPVFSLNLFEPVFHFERMHGESTFLPPFRKHPTI